MSQIGVLASRVRLGLVRESSSSSLSRFKVQVGVRVGLGRVGREGLAERVYIYTGRPWLL